MLSLINNNECNENKPKAANTMLVASSPKDSATARAAFIRSQQQHLSVTAVASVKKPAQRDKQVRQVSW